MQETTSARAPAILGIGRNWWVIAAVLPILLLMGFASTIADIPMPVIIDEIDSDKYRFQWVTGAALLSTLMGMSMIRWLRDRFGLKKIHVTGVFIFAVASMFCGMAEGWEFLAGARFVQGFGRGLCVATILALFYRELPDRKDLAMALYGVGIYFGKAIAPTIGAYLTDYPSWRWTFYINGPSGLLAGVAACWILRPDRPEDANPEPFDFPGMGLLMLWITTLMVCLYRGQKWGWLTSNTVVVLLMVFTASFVLFIVWELRTPGPLIDVRLFKNRTFALAECVKSLYAVNLYTVISILCAYMLTLRHYPRTTTGLVLLPGALAMGLALVIGALLAKQVDRKNRLLLGLVIMALGAWLLSAVDLYTDKRWLAALFAFWGIGAGLVVSPVICIPLEGLTQAQVVSSACIKNMVRSLPGAVGSVVILTLVTRQADVNFDSLRQNIRPNRPVLENVTARLKDHLNVQSGGNDLEARQTKEVIEKYLHDNAKAFAYQTALKYLALCCLVAVVLALFIQAPKGDKPAGVRSQESASGVCEHPGSFTHLSLS